MKEYDLHELGLAWESAPSQFEDSAEAIKFYALAILWAPILIRTAKKIIRALDEIEIRPNPESKGQK